jgi:hypothetical protein
VDLRGREETGGKQHNEVLHNLHPAPNIMMIKSNGELKKIAFEIHRYRSEDNINMDLK